MKTYIQESNAT